MRLNTSTVVNIIRWSEYGPYSRQPSCTALLFLKPNMPKRPTPSSAILPGSGTISSWIPRLPSARLSDPSLFSDPPPIPSKPRVSVAKSSPVKPVGSTKPKSSEGKPKGTMTGFVLNNLFSVMLHKGTVWGRRARAADWSPGCTKPFLGLPVSKGLHRRRAAR